VILIKNPYMSKKYNNNNNNNNKVRQQDAYTTKAGLPGGAVKAVCKGNISVVDCIPLSSSDKTIKTSASVKLTQTRHSHSK